MQQTVQNRPVPFWAQPGFDPWAGCPDTFYATKLVREGRSPRFVATPGARQSAPGVTSARSTGMRPMLGAR